MVAPGDAQAHHGPENPLNFQHHFNSPQHSMGTPDGAIHYGINEHPSAFSTQYNGSHFLPSAQQQQSSFAQSTPPHYAQPDFNSLQMHPYPGYQHQQVWHQSPSLPSNHQQNLPQQSPIIFQQLEAIQEENSDLRSKLDSLISSMSAIQLNIDSQRNSASSADVASCLPARPPTISAADTSTVQAASPAHVVPPASTTSTTTTSISPELQARRDALSSLNNSTTMFAGRENAKCTVH